MADNIFEWCMSVIVTTPGRWLSLIESVPVELLLANPAPGEWSALECLQHLVEVEHESFPVRLNALRTGQPIAAFNPSDRGAKPPPTIALAHEFHQLRQANLALLKQVGTADLDRQTLHAEYGMVSMREFLHHRAAHDLMHTVQAERALMQPFIRGCGPWVEVYRDHIAQRTE